jgi:hypothetical protein
MRMSELLRSSVLDSNGEHVGRVHDVRMVREGPVQGAFGPAYVLQGLVVGPGAVGARLGFDRTDVKGPYPLKVLFRQMHKNARFVEWAVIDSVEGDVVRLKVPAADLPPVPQLPK